MCVVSRQVRPYSGSMKIWDTTFTGRKPNGFGGDFIGFPMGDIHLGYPKNIRSVLRQTQICNQHVWWWKTNNIWNQPLPPTATFLLTYHMRLSEQKYSKTPKARGWPLLSIYISMYEAGRVKSAQLWTTPSKYLYKDLDGSFAILPIHLDMSFSTANNLFKSY